MVANLDADSQFLEGMAFALGSALAYLEDQEGRRQLIDSQLALLESLPGQLALLDSAGRIVTGNLAWREQNPQTLGRAYLECFAERSPELKSVLNGERESMHGDFPREQGNWLRFLACRLGPDFVMVAHLEVRPQPLRLLTRAIAHDFKNLLTVIRGFADLMKNERPADHPDQENLGEILRSAEQAGHLADELLGFSDHRPRAALLDLNRMLQRVGRTVACLVGPDITLELKPASAPAWVRADSGRLERSLLNLVLNARQSMPDGGRLRLEVGRLEPAARPDELPDGHYLRLDVRDWGCGLTEPQQLVAFQPGFTTRPGQGCGLGLNNALEFARQAGGTLQCHSTPGSGSTFRIVLPAHGCGHCQDSL